MGETVLSPFKYYRDLLEECTGEELHALAHAKRFLECVTGDAEFRARAEESPRTAKTLAASRGCRIDPEDIDPLWRDVGKDGPDPEKVRKYPLAALWSKWLGNGEKKQRHMIRHGSTPEVNPRFDAWRSRQIARCRSQFSRPVHREFGHPVISFELSAGCSVGCKFCGISAGPLKGVFRYTEENAALWRGVLKTAVELFGDAAQTGFCYWATEPADNPDYVRFVRDFADITGELPQTTTAVPLRDPAWTREVIALHRERLSGFVRFSILSVGQLRRVHEGFSPEELLFVKLLLYHHERHFKTRAGRQLVREMKRAQKGGKDSDRTISGSIACMSGFLLNMVEGRARLLSPWPADEDHINGYESFAEARFASAADFGEFARRTIERLMHTHVPNGMLVGFREDLSYGEKENGFVLSSRYMEHAFNGSDYLPRLGMLIRSGDRSLGVILDDMIDAETDTFAVLGTIQHLFENGLLVVRPGPDGGAS